MEVSESIDWFHLSLGITAGLTLFLFGVSQLGDALKESASERVRKFLERATRNRFLGVASGAVTCTLLDSSSATVIIVIGLVSSGLMTFVESLGVVMGANIGTTVSSQIFALKLTNYGALALAAGFLLRLSTHKTWSQVGWILFSLGLVFFGLEQIESAVHPLRDYAPFRNWMLRTESVWFGVLVGAVFTAIIQSSSAMMGIIILLAGHGTISLASGIALMMGAEIGTCADTLVASIGRSREALRTGLFQLCFNIFSVLLWMGFAAFLARLASSLDPNDVSRQLAHAHVIFNVSTVMVALPFLTPVAKALKWLVPETPGTEPSLGMATPP